MKHHRESRGISNFGQFRQPRCTLSIQVVSLHISSDKVMIFGFPKSGGFLLNRIFSIFFIVYMFWNDTINLSDFAINREIFGAV